MPSTAEPSTYCRVAPLMDEGFKIPKRARKQGTTKRCRPWLRWTNVGDISGWYAVGERKPDFGAELSFWAAVLTLATRCGNGHLDAVHCIGPGILSVGGLGVTASSGYAQQLLAECLRADPLHWLRWMGPALAQSQAWLQYDELDVIRLVTEEGVARSWEQINYVVRHGAGSKWMPGDKLYAKTWVEAVSQMLRSKRMDDEQVAFCQRYVPQLAAGAPAHSLSWPQAGARDKWMFTPEQQALWAVGMVACIEDERQAATLLKGCVETRPRDAKKSLLNLHERVQDAAHTATFVRRVRTAVEHCQGLFRIELGIKVTS